MTRPWTTAVNKTPGRLRPGAGDERLLDDVEDAADDQPDAPALAGVDDDLDRVVAAGLRAVGPPSGVATGLPFASRCRRRRSARDTSISGRISSRYCTTSCVPDPFEGGARELLQPGHLRQRDGHAAAVARGEQQDGLAVAGRLGRAGRLLGQRPFADAGDDVGLLGQAQHVEDQGHLAVAHDGGAGEGADALELLLQRLDHDLLGVVDGVHDQPELAVVGLQDDDVDLAVRPRAADSTWSCAVRGRPAAAGCRGAGTPGAPWICSMPRWACSPSSRTSSSRLTWGMA